MGETEQPRGGIVIAIDGPAGAGKTTVAKGVAIELAIAHLDTGAMYRALTAKALAAGIAPTDEAGLVSLAGTTRMFFTPEGLVVDGRPVGPEIRTLEVNAVVSAVSAHAGVRREMVRIQREIMAEGGIVAEGRDIGTVVYPDAGVKVFLTASIQERARRRLADHADAGEKIAPEQLLEQIEERDRLDSTRPVSPLKPAGDATVIDTTGKTPEQVIGEIVDMARKTER